MKQQLALKKKAAPPVAAIIAAANDNTANKAAPAAKKKLVLSPKNSDSSVFTSVTKGGFTPLGLEAKDSLQKNGVGSAARTVARGIAKEVTDSFSKKTVDADNDTDTPPDNDADDFAAKESRELDKRSKLKRMSQQITRGTPAANKNPFKKKGS